MTRGRRRCDRWPRRARPDRSWGAGSSSRRSPPSSRTRFVSSARNGRRRRGNQLRHAAGIALGLEESLTQVDEVALGLLFAGAASIGLRDARSGERIVANYHDVAGDDVSVLEREYVERPRELVPREKQRHAEPAAMPLAPRAARRAPGRRTSRVRPGRAFARGVSPSPSSAAQAIDDERMQPGGRRSSAGRARACRVPCAGSR